MTSNQIFDKARELMVELSIHELPINPFAVTAQLHIPTVSYKEAAEAGYTALIENVLRGKAEADAFCYRNNGQYIIFYDEKRTPPNRINFTIAHEIGHIRLDHFQQDGYYTRYQLNKKGDFKEREADSFAGELLRPPVLLALADIETPRDISIFCNITKAAATIGFNAINSIKKHWNYDHIALVASFFKRQFAEFLTTYYCRNCNSTFSHDENDHYCPICGATDITHKFVLNEGGLKSIMHYPLYDLHQCLVCENEEISADDAYCKICGTPLVNTCTNEQCQADADNNARYCVHCGAPTTFFQSGALKPWREERFGRSPDEEIPF